MAAAEPDHDALKEDAPWVPLESNPAVLNEFMWTLGCSRAWAFTDIFGLDPELLAMLPQPVRAILLLFPITEKHEAHAEQEARAQTTIPKAQWYTRQTIGNACGTIAVLHALLNNTPEPIVLEGNLKALWERTRTMSPEQRAVQLEKDISLRNAHASSAQEGQTTAPDPAEDVDLHFICFVHVNGRLLELDGRKKFPIDHGPSSEDTFLGDAATAVQAFMGRDPDQLQFTMMALAPNAEED